MGAILEKLPTVLTVLATICGGVTVALMGGMAIWTWKDARSRSRDVLGWILATLMVIVLPGVGLVVYFMLRPKETLAEAYEHSLEQEALLQAIEDPELCPNCGERCRSSYLFCPACHAQLKQPCPSCGQALDPDWTLCPYCATRVQPQARSAASEENLSQSSAG